MTKMSCQKFLFFFFGSDHFFSFPPPLFSDHFFSFSLSLFSDHFFSFPPPLFSDHFFSFPPPLFSDHFFSFPPPLFSDHFFSFPPPPLINHFFSSNHFSPFLLVQMASSTFFSVMSVLANANLFPFVIALFIGIPSALLYCLELMVITTNFAHFNSAFFVFVAFRAVSSLINLAFTFFGHRFGKIGLFLPIYLKLPRFVLASFLFFFYYTFYMENLLTTFLSLNRLTAILFPTNYEKLWRLGLPLFLAVTFIFPLPLSIPFLNLNMYIHVQNDNVTFTLDNYNTNNETNYAEVATWASFVFGIVCLLLNLASIFAYKLKQNGPQSSAIERKMTIYAVLSFFGHFIGTIFWIIVTLTSTSFLDEQNHPFSYAQAWFGLSSDENETLFLANFNQFPWVNDLSMLAIPAWLLLWASTKMNEIVAKKFKWIQKRIEPRSNNAIVAVQNNFVPFSPKINNNLINK